MHLGIPRLALERGAAARDERQRLERGLKELNNQIDEFTRLVPHDDLVVFDQRGTGQSGLLRCRDLEWANGLDPGTAATGYGLVLVESVSRFSRVKSARMSAAC